MKDFRNKIEQMIHDRKIHSRWFAGFIALSILIGFIVPLGLIQPGVAITNSNLNDGVDWFSEAYNTPVGENFTNYVQGKFVYNGNEYKAEKGKTLEIDVGNADPATFNVDFNYELTKDQLKPLLSDPFAYYQIDSKVKLDREYIGQERTITDSDWSGTKVAGYYSINKDGLIVIHYTADYIEYLKTSNGLRGTLNFNATVSRDKSADGDVNFTFGSTQVKLKFDDSKPTMQKNGNVIHNNDGSYDIEWTITINNPNGYVDLSQYGFNDTLDGNAVDWGSVTDFSVDPPDSATQNGNGSLTFKNYVNNAPQAITIKYKQKGAALGGKYKNSATLTKGETSIPAEKEVSIENGLNISKSGKPDYEIQSGANNKIQWTIDVSHRSGDSLKKVIVTEQSMDFGGDVIVKDKSTGAIIDSSKYDVSGKTLTFKDDNTIPSSVEIVFWSEVENPNTTSPSSTQVQNKASAKRDDINEVSTKDVWVGYQHELKLDKSLISPNQETGELEWQFTITANQKSDNNADTNSKESINGYKLTDPIFADMTEQQIINSIDYSVYYHSNPDELKFDKSNPNYGFAVTKDPNDPKTVIITFDEEASGYDKNKPINKIVLKYKTTIKDSLTADDWNRYQNGEKVTIVNEATAKTKNEVASSQGRDQGEIQQRVDSAKSYNGADNSNNYSLGNEDTTNRILNWRVTLTKDAGFKSGDVYKDVLKSSDANVPHYITPGQRTGITNSLKGAVTAGGESTALTNEMYTITFYKDEALTQQAGENEDAVGFKIEFKDNVPEEYNFIYFDYSSTAKTSEVDAGTKVTFKNGYSFNDPNFDNTDGMTYERDNPADVKKITLGLNKSWDDSNNEFGSRPAAISVTVYQAEADENGNLPSNPDWKEYKKYSLDVNASGESQSYTLAGELDGEFPRWKYDSENGKAIYYYYKVIEDPVDGYTLTEQSNEIKATANSTFSLKNTCDQDFGKVALDSSGNTINAVNLSDGTSVPIETVTINGKPTRCYMFNWKIVRRAGKDEKAIEEIYVDTLPAGAVYIDKTDNKLSAYFPKFSNYDGWTSELMDWAVVVTPTNGQSLEFKFLKDNIKYVHYYTAIPVDSLSASLDADGNLINKVTKDGTEYEAKIKINGEAPEERVEPLTKTSVASVVGGRIIYNIDVNPQGKKLSNTGTIDITDFLEFKGGTKSLDQLTVNLYSIDVHPIVNGTVDENTSLKGQFGYTVDYGKTFEKTLTWNDKIENKVIEIFGWKAGEQVEVTVQQNGDLEIKALLSAISEQANGNFNDYSGGATKVSFPAFSNGQSTVSIDIPDNAIRLGVFDNGQYNNGDPPHTITKIVDAKSVKKYPAVLNITVPDEQPLRITYSYDVTGWTAGDEIYFANTASFEADNDSGKWSTESEKMNANSGGTAEALRFPTIYKTEVGNEALDYLSASFAVAKYIDNQWVYASEVKTETEGKSHRSFTFPNSPYDGYLESNGKYPQGAALLKFADEDDPNTVDMENVHEFNLDPGTLYKFVEVVAPKGYRQPNWEGKTLADNSEFVFYYSYAGYTGGTPPDATGKVTIIRENQKITIPNSKNISISAEKSFSGSAEDIPTQSEVKLALYWANNKNGTGLKLVSGTDLDLPSSFNPNRTITYKSDGTGIPASWGNLPTGKNGVPIYYYVREISYRDKSGTIFTLDEESGTYKDSKGNVGKFKPVYTKNGTNTDGTVIEVNNSVGIVVRKLWVDKDGKPVTPPKDVDGSNNYMSVGFTVYGIQGTTKIPLDLKVKQLTYPEYEYVLPDSVVDTDGNHYNLSDFDNFEIAENLTNEQKISMYAHFLPPKTTRKISNGTGTLEIINTDMSCDTTDAVVHKVWKDGDVDHTNDKLTVMLVQSTNHELTSEQLASIVGGASVDGVFTGNSIKSSSAVQLIELGRTKTLTYDKEIASVAGVPNGIGATRTDKTLTLTGSAVASSEITVTFKDNSTEEFTVSVIEYETNLGKQNDDSVVWSKTWKDLPYDDGDGHNYYYYVVEKAVPTNYSVSYDKTTTSAGQTTTITNSLPTEMIVQKKWYDENGKLIETNSSSAGYDPILASSLPDSIQIEVYQKLRTETIAGELHLDKPSSIKVAAYGDSITKGTIDNYVDESSTYPNVLQNEFLTVENGYNNSTVYKIAENGRLIDNIKDQIQYDTNISSADIICVIAGTNDIINTNVAVTSKSGESLEGKMRGLIERFIGDNGVNRDAVLMIGKIPRFMALTWSNSRDIPQSYNGNSAANEVPIQKAWDSLVSEYNTMLTNLVNEYKQQDKKIVLVDVYTAVGNNLVDGCHPDATGYKAIADAFYREIEKIYVGADATTRENPVNISMPGDKADISTQFSGTPYGTYTLEKSKGYKIGLPNLPERNGAGTEYVYYVKEVGTHILDSGGTYYTISGDSSKYIKSVTYENNGQLASDSGTVVINNKIKTTELNVEKQWNDDKNHSGDTITVRIHRETMADPSQAQENALILSLDAAENGTIMLPKSSEVTVTANKPGLLGPSSDILELTTDAAQKSWTIKPKAGASVGDIVELTFTDNKDEQKYSFKVQIVDDPALSLEISPTTVEMGGNEPTVTNIWYTPPGSTERQSLNASDANVTFASSKSDVIAIDSNGNMQIKGLGTTDITVSYKVDGKTITSPKIPVEVKLPETFTVDSVTVAKGATAQLKPNPNYGTFTYAVNPGFEGKVSVNEKGEVTGIEEGDYTEAITVTRSDGTKCYVNVTVNAQTLKTGDIPLEITQNHSTTDNTKKVKYSYDVSTGIITLTIPKSDLGGNCDFKFNAIKSNNDLKDLIPTKYEFTGSSKITTMGAWFAKSGWEPKYNSIEAGEYYTFEADNTKTIGNHTSDMGFWIQDDAGPFTVIIHTQTSSSSGGNEGGGNESEDGWTVVKNVTVNQNLTMPSDTALIQLRDENNGYLPKYSAGTKITFNVKGDANSEYQFSAGGHKDNDSGAWTNMPVDDSGVRGRFDENGNATFTIDFTIDFVPRELQLWWYSSGGNNRTNVKLESYTISTPNANTASVAIQQAPRRLTSRIVRMSTAQSYASAPRSEIPSESTVGAGFNESGYMDIEIKAIDNWSKKITGLPMYAVSSDGTVLPCYYWAEEVQINGKPVAGYQVGYAFDDGDSGTSFTVNAANPGNAMIHIKNTPTESPAYELPETGGHGTAPYTAAGMAIMLSAGTIIFFKRRYREKKRKSA